MQLEQEIPPLQAIPPLQDRRLPRPIAKLLVANRGEIACRIFRSAQSEGMQTVAVYSEADRDALHTQMADEAYLIGASAASESYLRGEKIVEVARRAGADAIHPGYGFLAEDSDFVQACEAAGLIFVGPGAASMRALGNKSAARQLALQLGIPVRPGYDGEDQSDTELERQARTIGYPLMVKAAAGGGGRGMRAVMQESDLREALGSARAEALAAFGNQHLLLEALLQHARHLEVQIIADQYGKILALAERDCTTQRRHQKIIEEAPAPGLDGELRSAIRRDAIRLAHAAGYCGAATVEFLLEPDGRYTLLEVNTRLQVEHPVTEAITGLDLVALQLRIAQGEPLPLEQHEVAINGHAIEVRLCAEDPARGYLAQAGPVHAMHWPQMEGLRIDHGLHPGCTMSADYDPLMAKIIAKGRDRPQAVSRLLRALEQFRLLGPRDNRHLLCKALVHPGFAELSSSDTAWLETALERGELLIPAVSAAPERIWVCAAAALAATRAAQRHDSLRGFQSTARAGDPAALTHTMRIRAQHHPRSFAVKLRYGASHAPRESAGPRHCTWLLADGAAPEGAWVRVQVPLPSELPFDMAQPSYSELRIDGRRQPFLAYWTNEGLHLDLGSSQGLAILDDSAEGGDREPDREGVVRSSMHGRVGSIEASVGTPVEKGALLMRLEAMKIQHRVEAPCAGVLRVLSVEQGQQVSAGQSLAIIEADAQTAPEAERNPGRSAFPDKL